MKQTYAKYLMVAALAGGFLFTSCRTARETTAQYEITKVEGSMITIDSVWDTIPNAKAAEILKPYKEKDIIKIIDVFLNSSPLKSIKEGNYTFIDIDSNISVKLYHNDIIYIEYSDKTCDIHTISGIYSVKRTSLAKVLKSINDENIIQTHRSFAVNLKYVKEIEKTYEKVWNIKLRSCDDIALLSYTYRQAFLRGIE